MFTFSEPKQFDLQSRTNDGLIALYHNGGKHNRVDIQVSVLRELHRRRKRIRKFCGVLAWTPDRAQEVIETFAAISERCENSKRTDFSKRGGGVFKAANHPDARWVDTYTAVKAGDFNAEFSCHIREPGDDAEFVLNIRSRKVVERFTADQLDVAMERWIAVVDEARGKLRSN